MPEVIFPDPKAASKAAITLKKNATHRLPSFCTRTRNSAAP